MVGPRRNEESFENDGVGCQAYMQKLKQVTVSTFQKFHPMALTQTMRLSSVSVPAGI